MTEKPLYNSALINNYIELLKSEYPHIDITDLLDEANIDVWKLDPGHWFTQSEVNRFNKILFARTGNPHLPREAGRFSVTYRSGNIMRQAALSLMSPSSLYDIIDKIGAKYSRAVKVSVKKLTSHKYELTYVWEKDVRPEPFQCQNIIGYLEAVYFVFRSKLPTVEHPECLFKNGNVCRYIISWDRTPSEIIEYTRNIVSFIYLICLLPLSFYGNIHIYKSLTVFVFFILLTTIASLFSQKKDLLNIVGKQEFKPYDVLESYNRYHKSTNLFKKVGVALSKNKSVSGFMNTVSDIYVSFGYPAGLIVLLDYSNNIPRYGNVYLFENKDGRFIEDIKEKEAPFAMSQKSLNSPIVQTKNKISGSFPDEIIALLDMAGFDSIVYVPIVYENALLGFVFIKNNKPSIHASDLYILHSIASQSALSITNISFYESLLISEKVKMDFVTVASHELLTPVQTINLASHDIKSHIEKLGITGTDLQESFAILDQSVYKLGSISKNILNFKKLEADSSLAPVDLKTIITSTIKESTYITKTHRHQLIFDSNKNIKRILCNKATFIQLLCNLIENSSKYTPDGGTIEVSFDLNPAELTVSVTDNGIGLDKIHHEEVFMKFFQVDTNQPGAGLGLSFCQDVAKKHEGYITIDSPIYPDKEIRKGTKIIIHLPVDKAGIE